jgi:UDP-N-acetylmuramoyl-tripeptide--D-alanyl-D-alanine ligase
MNPLSISKIAEMSGGRLLSGNPDAVALRVCKDTRTLSSGDLYIALRGENFDGNRFIAEAAAKGAVAALCDMEAPSGLPGDFGILGTADALTGLTLLAAAWRSCLNLRPVVITGSSGKTSVKDFTATVLSSQFRTASTKGNLNNQIGLPLSILETNLEDEAAVWEIGMNHRGEIAPLAGLAKPVIGIITGIGTAHIEYLGSKQEIAREKGDLLERLPDDGTAIIPAEDEFSGELRGRTNARVVSIGFDHGDLRAVSIKQDLDGSRFMIEGEFGTATAFLPVPGRHMIGNALMAVATGLLSGISLEQCAGSLANVSLTNGRLGRVVKRGVNILDDTYNANPDSMVAALETIAHMKPKGRKFAVLGKMGELGIHASEGYRRVGKKAATTLDTLICVGEEASEIAEAAASAGLKDVRKVTGNAEASRLLSTLSKEGDLVLLKASRSARLEEVLHQFI